MPILVFEVLWEALGLPLMPARIAVDQHGINEEERRRYLRQAEAAMARLELGSLRNIKPEVGELLELLARHDRGLGWRELLGDRRRAYVAAHGSRAAGAVIDGERVAISGLPADRMVGWILDLLPPAGAGFGSAYSMPTDVYERAVRLAVDGKGSSAQRNMLRSAGVAGVQANQLELLTRTTVNTGSISAHRGSRGNAKPTGSLAYTDTPRGRYLLLQRPDRQGRNYTSIVPADLKVIRQHAVELMEQPRR